MAAQLAVLSDKHASLVQSYSSVQQENEDAQMKLVTLTIKHDEMKEKFLETVMANSTAAVKHNAAIIMRRRKAWKSSSLFLLPSILF